VKTAFLNADMEHEVWMMPSENLEHMYEKLMAASDITPEERKMLRKHISEVKRSDLS
jgi:DNA-binding transcriptional regulator/RsmH inhibitor MraZ